MMKLSGECPLHCSSLHYRKVQEGCHFPLSLFL